MWINGHTGEVLDQEPDDAMVRDGVALWLPPEDVPAEPSNHELDESWIPNWLAKQELHLAAELNALEIQHGLMVAAVNTRRRYLDYRYRRRAEAQVRLDIEVAGGKKKSHNYPFGTCGFRTSKRVEVVDKEEALAWALVSWPEAVKTETKTSLLKSKLPPGDEVPGVKRVTETKFYVKPAVPKS